MKDNLPIRKKLRLQDYDYSEQGLYFVTICIKNRIEILGSIKNNQIKLTAEGIIAENHIRNIENIFNRNIYR